MTDLHQDERAADDITSWIDEEPLTKRGLGSDEIAYMRGDAKLAEPSLFNTNSIYLNNPYYRDVYTQIALRRVGPDVPHTYVIPMVGKAIGEVTDYADFARVILAETKANPEFAAWLKARRHTGYRPEDVAHHPEGTLGHAIWEFLTKTGYQMDALQFGRAKVAHPIDYISQRRGGTHDIEHMVTGFGPNAAGEVALLWCNITALANYFSPDMAHYMSAGLTFIGTSNLQSMSLHYRDAFPTFLEATQRGIEAGRALKRPLLLEPWEDMLDQPLDLIRANLGIRAGPGKGWDWTTDASAG